MRNCVVDFLDRYPMLISEYHVISLGRWLRYCDSTIDRKRVYEILSEAWNELGGLPPIVDELFEELQNEFE